MKQTYDFNVDGNVVALTPNTEPKAEAPKHPKENRTRRFALTSYIDPSELSAFLKRAPWVQHWAMCTHDKDQLEGETLKEKHTHVLLYTYQAKTSSAIRKNFDRLAKEVCPEEPQNTLCQEMHDTVKMWRYLRHLDNPEKYQYPEEARICNDKTYWQKYERTDGMNDSAKNTGFAMFDDLDNDVPVKEMVMRYGKDFIYHYKQIKDVVSDHRAQTCSIIDTRKEAHQEIEKNADAFVSSMKDVLFFSSKYSMKQKQEFAEMLRTALELTELFEGVRYSILKTTYEGEIIN